VLLLASIINKKVKNYRYYYYVESKRVNKKPTLVNQKYLGTAAKILEKILQAAQPLQDRVLYSDEAEFGAVALLYDVAGRLGVKEIIDGVIPKRKQGASAGAYILTAAINRAVSPTSKSGLAEWYSGTCLPMITGLKPSAFSPQNFWNNTRITAEELDRIEETILGKIIDTYDVDATQIIYDATNFFTYIDTLQDDFTNEQIVAAYRNARRIESSLKQMKNPKHLAVQPIFHWTDEKIRVHIFTCALAYRLCRLLIRELSDRGVSITASRLIDEMSRIKRIHTFFGDINKPEKVTSYTLGNDTARQVEEIYQLKERYG
jgi:transposase